MPKSIQVTNIRHGNPGVSGWYAILEEPEPADVLDKDINTDWLVIGGGFAGLAAARRLLQLREKEQIVVLDSSFNIGPSQTMVERNPIAIGYATN